MINFDKLNGQIVSRETLKTIENQTYVSSVKLSGKTSTLDAYRVILTDGRVYRLYTYGGVISG